MLKRTPLDIVQEVIAIADGCDDDKVCVCVALCDERRQAFDLHHFGIACMKTSLLISKPDK